jgi:hypothetical protein
LWDYFLANPVTRDDGNALLRRLLQVHG